jgi:hypothetical protein
VSGVGDLELKQAQVGHQTNSLRINEIRAKLGERALSDDELAQLLEERKKLPQQQQNPFGAAASLAEHVPTKEETELEKELRRAVEDLADETYKALGG